MTNFFQEQLEAARKELIEKDVLYDLTLASGKYLNISNEIPEAIPTYQFRYYTRLGQAKVKTDRDSSVPSIDEMVDFRMVKVFPVRLGFTLEYDELDLCRVTGRNIISEKLATVREGIDQKLDLIAFQGEPGTTMQGLANNSNVTVISLPADGNQNGGVNSANWIHKTPLQVLRDLSIIIMKVPEQTKLTRTINRLLIPASKYLYLQTTPFNPETGKSILAVFLENIAAAPNGGVIDIVGHPVLETLGTGGVGRIIGYDTRSRANSFHIPVGGDFKDLDPSYSNTTWRIPCQAKTAGVQIERVLEVVYADVL